MALQSASSPRSDQGYGSDDNSTTGGINTPSSSVSSTYSRSNAVQNLTSVSPTLRQPDVDDNSTINRAVTPPASSLEPENDTRSGTQTPRSILHKAQIAQHDFNMPNTTLVEKIRTPSDFATNFLWCYDIVARVVLFGWLCYLSTSIYSHLFPINRLESSVVSHSNPNMNLSIPLPNHTYLIRDSSNKKYLTVQGGEVILAYPGRSGLARWECVQDKGWLGFRQAAYPGTFLGYDWHSNLVVSAVSQQGWENFVVSPILTGGYVLMMTHYERLWHVGFQGGRLAKVGDGADGGIVWEFIPI